MISIVMEPQVSKFLTKLSKSTNSTDKKDSAELLETIDLLSIEGKNLKLPNERKIVSFHPLRELRYYSKKANLQYRILYGFIDKNTALLIKALIKKGEISSTVFKAANKLLKKEIIK